MPDQPNDGRADAGQPPVDDTGSGTATAGEATVEMAAASPESAQPDPTAPQQAAAPIDPEMLAAFLSGAPKPTAAEAPEPAAAAPPASPAPAAGAPASHRRSARSTVLTVLGVVLLVVAVGAAGIYVGRLTAPAPEVVLQAPDEVVEEPPGAPLMPVGPLPVPAPGTVVITTARVPTSTWAVVLNGTAALSDDTGSAPGYRLVNQGISGAQVAGIIAATFGMSGSASVTDTGWEVGSPSGPRVSVVDDPLFSWYYDDPAAALPPSDEVLAPVDAIALATQTLTSIGVELTSVEYEVSEVDGRTAVSVWQLVGDQRTQLGWRMVFDADGSIVAASGFSSGFLAVPDYPVVGAATAVARSRQAPWTSIPASPITGPTDESETPMAPAPNTSGIPSVDLPMSEVDVLSAELGLAQYWQPDGSILLLPSYILTGADGSTWSLLAVAESAVRFVTQPYPLDGEQPGFVPEPFPQPSADEEADGLDGDGDTATPAPPTQDDGMVDEFGVPIAPPPEDPAAVE
jgi:hypothetical protein